MDDEVGAALGLFVAVFTCTYGALSLVDDLYDWYRADTRQAQYRATYFFTLDGKERPLTDVTDIREETVKV